MKRLLDLSGLSVPQLLEIRKVLDVGAKANAEKLEFSAKSQLCHKSPPAGYPKDKSEYGDPECYRYPLNTKSRCLSAWRYVHQGDNKSILGDKFKGIESKIKSYGKKHYNLDLQTGESEVFNWEQAFVEYYDGETMGERCDLIVLEPEDNAKSGEKMAEEVKIEEKVATLETELTTKKDELAKASTKVQELTTELAKQTDELTKLREFKKTTEEAAQRVEKIKGIKSKLDEAGIVADLETEADYWLSMNEDTLTKTIAKMKELAKGAKASASIKVPPVGGVEESDARKIVSEALKERKQAKDK